MTKSIKFQSLTKSHKIHVGATFLNLTLSHYNGMLEDFVRFRRVQYIDCGSNSYRTNGSYYYFVQQKNVWGHVYIY